MKLYVIVISSFLLAEALATDLPMIESSLAELPMMNTAIEDSTRELFKIVTSTRVIVNLVSTVAVSKITRLCATMMNVTGACRQRRGIEEKPVVMVWDEIASSPAEKIRFKLLTNKIFILFRVRRKCV